MKSSVKNFGTLSYKLNTLLKKLNSVYAWLTHKKMNPKGAAGTTCYSVTDACHGSHWPPQPWHIIFGWWDALPFFSSSCPCFLHLAFILAVTPWHQVHQMVNNKEDSDNDHGKVLPVISLPVADACDFITDRIGWLMRGIMFPKDTIFPWISLSCRFKTYLWCACSCQNTDLTVSLLLIGRLYDRFRAFSSFLTTIRTSRCTNYRVNLFTFTNELNLTWQISHPVNLGSSFHH